MKTITPFVLAALFCAGSAAGAQGLQSVVGVPVADISSPPSAQAEARFLKVRWTCHGGKPAAAMTDKCSRTLADWLAVIHPKCKAICLKQRTADPTRAGKCGINSLETASPCS